MKRLGHLAIIAHDMGVIFGFLALITLVPLIVLLVFQEWTMMIPMGSVPVIFFSLGFLISKVPKTTYQPSLSVALVAVVLTWLIVALVGVVPSFSPSRSPGSTGYSSPCQAGQIQG